MSTHADATSQFRSAGELRARHADLLARWVRYDNGSEVEKQQLIKDVDSFLQRGQRTGVLLEDSTVRSECQAYLSYWATRLARAEGESRPLAVLDEHKAEVEKEFGKELASAADGVYSTLDPTEQQAAAAVFLQLLRQRPRGGPTVRAVPESELTSKAGAGANEVIKRFLAADLLRISGGESSGEPTIEIAHESLIASWELLQSWLLAERYMTEQRNAFRAAAEAWIRDGQSSVRLLTVAQQLNDAKTFPRLSKVEADFLAASQKELDRRQREQELQKKLLLAETKAREVKEEQLKIEEKARQLEHHARRRWQWAAFGLIALTLCCCVAVTIAIRAYWTAEKEGDTARTQQQIAEHQRRLAQLNNSVVDALGPGQLGKGQAARLAEVVRWWGFVESEANKEGASVEDFQWAQSRIRQALHSELAAWQQHAVVRAHRGTIWDAAFSANGRIMASASADATIALWKVPEPNGAWPAPTFLSSGHSEPINSLAFHPVENKLISASDDGQVIIWDVVQAKADLPGWKPHGKEQVWGVACGKQFLATCGPDKSGPLRLWRLRGFDKEPEAVALMGVPKDAVVRVAIDPLEKRLACGGKDGKVMVWSLEDLSAPPLVFKAHDDWVFSIAFHPTDSLIASGGRDGTVKVWDLNLTGIADEQRVRFIRSGADWVNRVTFSPTNGRLLATAGDDNVVHVWDLATGQEMYRFGEGGGGINALVFRPDGTSIVAGGAGRLPTMKAPDGADLPEFGLSAWALAPTWEWTTLTNLRARVRTVAFSSDHELVAAGTTSPDSVVRIWKIKEPTVSPLNSVRPEFEHSHRAEAWGFWVDERVPVNVLGFAPSTHQLFAGYGDGTVQSLGAQSGQVKPGRKAHTGPINGLCVSPDGRRIATCGDDQRVCVWNAESGDPINDMGEGMSKKPLLHDNRVTGVAFLNRAGTKLLSVGSDRRAVVWTVGESPTELNPPSGKRSSKLNAVATDAEATRAAIARDDGEVELWDLTAQPPVFQRTFKVGLNGQALAVSFRPDGRMLAIAGSDGIISLWDVDSNERPAVELSGHRGAVYALAFSTDGMRLASGGFDQTVRIYSLDDRKLVEIAKSRLPEQD